MVEELVGPDLSEPPTLEQLDVRLKRVVPSCFPIEPGVIESCRSIYRAQQGKNLPGSEDHFFFLKASTVRVNPQQFGIESLLWDWTRLVKGKSEDAVHVAITPLIQFCLDFLLTSMNLSWEGMCSFSRNETEIKRSRTTSYLSGPDWMFHIRGILVFRGEEKGDSANTTVNEPRQELVTKIGGWNPIFFGNLEYIFGYALAGTRFQLCGLSPDKSTQYPEGACGVRIKSIGGLLNLENIAADLLLEDSPPGNRLYF